MERLMASRLDWLMLYSIFAAVLAAVTIASSLEYGIFGLAWPLLIVAGCLAILGIGGNELLQGLEETARELEAAAGTASDVQTNGGL